MPNEEVEFDFESRACEPGIGKNPEQGGAEGEVSVGKGEVGSKAKHEQSSGENTNLFMEVIQMKTMLIPVLSAFDEISGPSITTRITLAEERIKIQSETMTSIIRLFVAFAVPVIASLIGLIWRVIMN